MVVAAVSREGRRSAPSPAVSEALQGSVASPLTAEQLDLVSESCDHPPGSQVGHGSWGRLCFTLKPETGISKLGSRALTLMEV